MREKFPSNLKRCIGWLNGNCRPGSWRRRLAQTSGEVHVAGLLWRDWSPEQCVWPGALKTVCGNEAKAGHQQTGELGLASGAIACRRVATELRSNAMRKPRTLVRGTRPTDTSELQSNGMCGPDVRWGKCGQRFQTWARVPLRWLRARLMGHKGKRESRDGPIKAILSLASLPLLFCPQLQQGTTNRCWALEELRFAPTKRASGIFTSESSSRVTPESSQKPTTFVSPPQALSKLAKRS